MNKRRRVQTPTKMIAGDPTGVAVPLSGKRPEGGESAPMVIIKGQQATTDIALMDFNIGDNIGGFIQGFANGGAKNALHQRSLCADEGLIACQEIRVPMMVLTPVSIIYDERPGTSHIVPRIIPTFDTDRGSLAVDDHVRYFMDRTNAFHGAVDQDVAELVNVIERGAAELTDRHRRAAYRRRLEAIYMLMRGWTVGGADIALDRHPELFTSVVTTRVMQKLMENPARDPYAGDFQIRLVQFCQYVAQLTASRQHTMIARFQLLTAAGTGDTYVQLRRY